MKNSLSLLIQTIEELEKQLYDSGIGTDKAATIHYQAARLNTGLMQLLSLYRVQLDHLPLNIDEHYMEDVIDELLATNHNHISTRNIEVIVNQSPDLLWYFDVDLISVVLNDMLVNATRYGKKKLLINVWEDDNLLHFSVEDDGPGFPQAMRNMTDKNLADLDLSAGRTGLGLFFARLIAEAHQVSGNKGKIRLENGGKLGGGVFTLILP
ncbi:MAG: sensor histidine kinase [Aestuariibacter sp.]